MLTLVNILIVFFIMLICFQIILANHIVEGLETGKTYKNYDTNNIISMKSAGCISSWVRPPLLAQFFLCNDIFIKKMFPGLYNRYNGIRKCTNS